VSQGGQQQQRPFVAQDAPPQPDGYCPQHDVAWNLVPAGVSKTKVDDQGNPKPYNAFWACPERGCDQKPPRGQAMTDLTGDALPF
jgi:hypothetical protein